MDAQTFLPGTGPSPAAPLPVPHPLGREPAGDSYQMTGGVHVAWPARCDLGSGIR